MNKPIFFVEVTNTRLEEWCNEEKNAEQNQEEKDSSLFSQANFNTLII